MKEPVFFCKSWFRAKRRAIEPWTEEKAQQAHVSGNLYAALIGSQERPRCVLEIAAHFVGVEFLDEQLREALSYQFQLVEPGRLFLSMATYREFVGLSDQVSVGTTYFFSRDGTVKIERLTFEPHGKETSDSTVDVSPNYSSFPSFGEYGDLIRIER